MKKLFIYIGLFFITVISFAEPILVSTNGETTIKFDTRYKKIVSAENRSEIIEKNIGEIEIGYILNNKIYYLRDILKSTGYLQNTNIIKLFSMVKGIKIYTYIYTPKFENIRYIYIYNEFISDEMNKKVNIQSFYSIKKREDGAVINDNLNKEYIYNKIYYKSLLDNSNLYLATEKDFENFKLKKIYDQKEKKDIENMIIINSVGKLESYDKKNDGIAIKFGKIKDEMDNLNIDYIIDNEVDDWSYWNENSEIKDKMILQDIILLKAAQDKNGLILSNSKDDNIVIEKYLYEIEAFIVTGHYAEAKKSLKYILDKNLGMIYSYSYNIITKKLENRKSYHNFGVFLRVYSEYIDKSGDINFLKKYFRTIIGLIENRLFPEIKDGLLKDSYSNENYGFYAISQWLIYDGLEKFRNTIKFFAPKGLITKYETEMKLIKTTFNKTFFNRNYILDKLKSKSFNLRDIICIKNNFFNSNDVTKELLNFYTKNFKIKDENGFSKILGGSLEDFWIELDVLDVYYELGLLEMAENLKNRIDNFSKSNSNILPEYILHGGIKKYGDKGIDYGVIAKYIVVNYGR
ncbi:hypothetical protein [Haliovirga abyssi]|uniref:Uncharacterized protein n=1 Tax=Haliovirga abyssi TaxID=2996794 RepID=A0AAU9DX27_9FUSO|nr:hypothetical protein [Haliovirga abyssi]BDU50926.1 hypothetical protein HLVA_14950 [Haliovirga abyssi]